MKTTFFFFRILYGHIRTNQTVTYKKEIFRKHFLWSGTAQLCFGILLFEQNFCQYVTVCLGRKWTHKKAIEKAHTFLKSKNVKKTDEKRMLCKSALN